MEDWRGDGGWDKCGFDAESLMGLCEVKCEQSFGAVDRANVGRARAVLERLS